MQNVVRTNEGLTFEIPTLVKQEFVLSLLIFIICLDKIRENELIFANNQFILSESDEK